MSFTFCFCWRWTLLCLVAGAAISSVRGGFYKLQWLRPLHFWIATNESPRVGVQNWSHSHKLFWRSTSEYLHISLSMTRSLAFSAIVIIFFQRLNSLPEALESAQCFGNIIKAWNKFTILDTNVKHHHQSNKQGHTGGLSRLHRPQCATGTYLVDTERIAGNVDPGGIWSQNVRRMKCYLSIFPGALTILPAHRMYFN